MTNLSERNSRDILKIFWDSSGDILESLWRHSGDILKTFWGHSGDFQKTFWKNSEDILDTFLRLSDRTTSFSSSPTKFPFGSQVPQDKTINIQNVELLKQTSKANSQNNRGFSNPNLFFFYSLFHFYYVHNYAAVLSTDQENVFYRYICRINWIFCREYILFWLALTIKVHSGAHWARHLCSSESRDALILFKKTIRVLEFEYSPILSTDTSTNSSQLSLEIIKCNSTKFQNDFHFSWIECFTFGMLKVLKIKKYCGLV